MPRTIDLLSRGRVADYVGLLVSTLVLLVVLLVCYMCLITNTAWTPAWTPADGCGPAEACRFGSSGGA